MQRARVVINMKHGTATIIYDQPIAPASPTCSSPQSELPESQYQEPSRPQQKGVVFIDDTYVLGIQGKILQERRNGCKKKSAAHDSLTKFFTLKTSTM
jgi:hypothetical protein